MLEGVESRLPQPRDEHRERGVAREVDAQDDRVYEVAHDIRQLPAITAVGWRANEQLLLCRMAAEHAAPDSEEGHEQGRAGGVAERCESAAKCGIDEPGPRAATIARAGWPQAVGREVEDRQLA